MKEVKDANALLQKKVDVIEAQPTETNKLGALEELPQVGHHSGASSFMDFSGKIILEICQKLLCMTLVLYLYIALTLFILLLLLSLPLYCNIYIFKFHIV